MASRTRPYDIILFGATGFTGQLTADYLLKCGEPVKFALAGRNPEKLAHIRDVLMADNPGIAAPDILTADSHDRASLEALCAQTRVVITTVGPYLLYGEPLVAACVNQGCDYVDLTGEPQFVSNMQQIYGAAARAKGVKIVHCCGFDSIPHDLGVYFTLEELAARYGRDVLAQSTVEVEGFVRGFGDISGGTWNSAINAMPAWKQFVRDRRRQHHQSLSGRNIRLVEKPMLKKLADGWAAPLPTIDPAIVVQSAARYGFYGKDFSYAHFAVTPQLARIAVTGAAIAGVFVVAQFNAGREWLGKRRPSGAGPAPEVRSKHWYTVNFEADVKLPGKPVLHFRTQVSGGDPGYDETAKMLAESALCLALDGKSLPAHFGVVTPAEAMGGKLVERLKNAGMGFEVRA